jgi:hypothetical protein
MQGLRGLLNPAGGLRYHARALRHRRRRWQSFTISLAQWLESWEPRATALFLVGPSAGYCLPADWLGRFTTIDAIDPDPLARLLLMRRFPGLRGRLRWHHAPYLEPAAGGFSRARLDRLARDFSTHAILFCNLLGQLRILHPEAVEAPSFAAWKRDLAGVLADRAWATFHDRLSGPVAPQVTVESVAGPLTDEELVDRFYTGERGRRVELETHGTADLFPALPRRYLSWEITPGWFHLIEAIHS